MVAQHQLQVLNLQASLKRTLTGWELSQNYIGDGSLFQAIAQALLLGVSAESHKSEDANRLRLCKSAHAPKDLMHMKNISSTVGSLILCPRKTALLSTQGPITYRYRSGLQGL